MVGVVLFQFLPKIGWMRWFKEPIVDTLTKDGIYDWTVALGGQMLRIIISIIMGMKFDALKFG